MLHERCSPRDYKSHVELTTIRILSKFEISNMNIPIFIGLILGIGAVASSHTEHSILCCPKMDTKTLIKSCTVCQQALLTTSAPFRVRAACATRARHQCCPSIEWTQPEQTLKRTTLMRVSGRNLLLFKNLHLIWKKNENKRISSVQFCVQFCVVFSADFTVHIICWAGYILRFRSYEGWMRVGLCHSERDA